MKTLFCLFYLRVISCWALIVLHDRQLETQWPSCSLCGCVHCSADESTWSLKQAGTQMSSLSTVRPQDLGWTVAGCVVDDCRACRITVWMCSPKHWAFIHLKRKVFHMFSFMSESSNSVSSSSSVDRCLSLSSGFGFTSSLSAHSTSPL